MTLVVDAARQLEIAQRITHIGSWEWNLDAGTVEWSDELYRIYGFEPRARPITLEFFLSCVHPDDRARLQTKVAAVVERGGRFEWPERIVRPDGSIRCLETVGEARSDESGRVTVLFGTCRDVTVETIERRLQQAEHRVLEMVARGAPLKETLTALVEAIEEHSPPVIGSVLLLDSDGVHVRDAAGPHLAEGYRRAIDGLAVGPNAGSCGTAVYEKRTVIVSDIATDPLWKDFRELAFAHGLRACWSVPILATDLRVLGTFGLYYREPRAPDGPGLVLLERASRVAGIAIERKQLEEQLRALSGHIESALEDERTAIAREIHDQLGQSLTALKMDIAWIARRTSEGPETGGASSREGLLDRLRAMSTMADEVIGQIRRISAGLRPGVLDDLGLVAAIEWQAQEFETRTGIRCTLESVGSDVGIEPALATAVFRVLQEALTNVARHAQAGEVAIRVDVRGDTLLLEVIDDGLGISPDSARNPKSLGLLGMRERARRLGGMASIGPAEPNGTRVALKMPLRREGQETPPR